MTTIAASFEGQASGTAFAAGAPGTANGDTYATAVSLGTGSAAVYSSTHGSPQTGSCALALSYTSSTGYVEFPLAATAGNRVSFRLWVYLPSGSGLQRLLIFRAGTGNTAYVSVTQTTGLLTFTDAGGTVQITSPAAFPTDQWVMVQGAVTVGSLSTNGVLELAYWTLSNLSTPAWSATTVTNANTGSNQVTAVRVGMSSSATATHTAWFDDFTATDTLASGYAGPATAATSNVATGATTLTSTLSATATSSLLPAATGATTLTSTLSATATSQTSATGATTLTSTLSATATSNTTVIAATPRGQAAFDMRLVGYQPLGARIGPIPDLGFTIADTASGPTLQAQVSTVVAGALPANLEVAVEWWHVTTQQWQEGRDSRFAVTQIDADDRDRTGTVTLTGIGLGAFLLAAAQLNGVDPFVNTTGTTEAVRSNAAVSVSGTTFTWPTHTIFTGDRVRITAKGNAKNLNTGSVYYVINATTNTFQLARGANSTTAINAGTASNIAMTRVVTRILFTGTNGFKKSDSVSVQGGSAIGLTDGSQYYVVGVTSNSIQLASQPGGIPIEFNAGATNVAQVYRYLDGQRVFNNATPGTVMDAVFLEARGRGWGVGTDGTTMMLHGWTTLADSTGTAWTKMADDPTTPGISIGFQPGTPGTQVLQALLDNQYAEWWTANGRTIHLVNYGTGNDHSADTTPMRIGTTASKVQVQTDLTGLRNAVTVRGTGPILTTAAASGSPWGRLEVYETAQGATSKTLAAKQASTDLAANQNPRVGYTVTEAAQEAAYLPLKDYQRCDWIAVQLAGTGWTRLRCVGWTFTKATTGAITVTANLENIKRTLLTKQQKAIVTTSAGLGSTSTPGSTLQESDNRPPAYPLGVTVSTVGFFGKDDSAEATATVSWLPVTTDINGADIQAVEYDVWIRPEGAFNGQSVGKTSGLSLDVTPLASGRYYEVSVRAKSSSSKWGELSPELEFLTNYPVTVPNPPTAPTVTGKLGSVRVAWDGNLVDPTLGNQAPELGFAYVYAAYSTTSGGTYTPAGANMGNAGYTPITGLSVGSTYWFALFAVNTVGVVSAMSSPVSFTVVGVKGPDIEANSVTANTIAAGAITADKLDVGTVPQGSPVNRVPMPVTATAFWSIVCAGASSLVWGTTNQVSSTSTGLAFTGSYPSVWLTQRLADVPSGTLHLSGLCVSGQIKFLVREWDSANAITDTLVDVVPGGSIFALQTTTSFYAIAAQGRSTSTSDTLEAAAVFEVLGAGGGGQAAQISPSGLRLFDDNGNLAVDLTTSTQQFFNIYDNTGGDPVSIASIDSGGNATFTEVSGSGFDIGGALLTDPTQPASLVNASPNGGGWGPTPLLDIGGHGVVYDVTWPSQDSTVVSTQFRRIAQDQFVLEDGRQYQLDLQTGGLACANSCGVNIWLELQFNLSPNSSIPAGTVVNRAIIHNGNQGYWAFAPVVWTASASQATIDPINRILPANVPIYWQLNFNLSSTPTSSYTLNEFGNSRGLTIIDIGSSYAVRPAGTDSLADVHDYSSSGASSGTSSGGTVAKSTTKTWTAAWSRTWNQSGANIVTGTGQYTNAKAMYQGNGVTPMGSQFGFAALGISGKTITGCKLYLRNSYFGYSGKSALLGTHGNSAAPATYTGARQNGWNVGWSQGQAKWITVPSSLWASIASGSIRGFSLGVDGSNGQYAIFEGVGFGSHPPQLQVTWH